MQFLHASLSSLGMVIYQHLASGMHLGWLLLQSLATQPVPDPPAGRLPIEVKIVASIIALVLLLLDLYAFQAIKIAFGKLPKARRMTIYWAYWSITVISVVLFAVNLAIPYDVTPRWFRWVVTGWTSLFVPGKLIVAFFMSVDDLIRLARWMGALFQPAAKKVGGEAITRSQFIAQAALVTGSIPVLATGWGIWRGAYAYRVEQVEVPLRNLPKAFEGFKIVQLSDAHIGSFNNHEAVARGIDMAMATQPDIICFTGDLVNNIYTEVDDYLDLFAKLKAPGGVYSILGNHDYGTYANWVPLEEREQLVHKLVGVHKQLGWDILLNENRVLERNGDQLALLGVENWGTGRFPRKGDLAKANAGLPDGIVKLLMSHDPSHWDAQIRPKYGDIQLTMSGHTHGMQFGVSIPGYKWSPVQYRYKQWGGLYTEGNQHLYVNRGFGFIGFPGRIGMPPEITVLKLHRA